MDQIKIGQFISKKRKEKGYTQNELGELLGVTGKTISRWETAKYMPDLSMLIPLSEHLNISVHELLSGEENINKIDDHTSQVVETTLNYSKMKIDEIKKNNHRIVFAGLLVFLLFFGICDLWYSIPSSWHEGDVSKWEDYYNSVDAYEMALNDENQPVFKNPNKAFKQAMIDYAGGIIAIQKEYHLFPLNKYNYRTYMKCGWELEPENHNKIVLSQASALSSFLDIYENSFK